MLRPPKGQAQRGASSLPALAKRPAGPKVAPAAKGNLDGDQHATTLALPRLLRLLRVTRMPTRMLKNLARPSLLWLMRVTRTAIRMWKNLLHPRAGRM